MKQKNVSRGSAESRRSKTLAELAVDVADVVHDFVTDMGRRHPDLNALGVGTRVTLDDMYLVALVPVDKLGYVCWLASPMIE